MSQFPPAVPEIPVSSIDQATAYYTSKLGFTLDWGDEAGGIAGISQGEARMFLTNPAFRQSHGNNPPVVIWFNLNSREEVLDLFDDWSDRRAKLVSRPEEKPWGLFEFTASDPNGNQLRVFYDFRSAETAEELPDGINDGG